MTEKEPSSTRQSPRYRRIVALMVLLLATFGSIANFPISESGANQPVPFGPVIISPLMGDWYTHQRPMFRAGEFDLVKVHLPTGYDTRPAHLLELIDDGARVVMLKTEDCESDLETTRRDLVESGFLDVIHDWPEIEFVIQVGNEPERCPLPIAQYTQGLYEIITELRPEIDEPNLTWVAGLPMVPETAIALLDEGWVQELYDGVGTNMLGHYSLTTEYHGWHEIVDYVLDETETELWITEIGINHPPMDKRQKAERILEYIETLPEDRVGGVALFVMAEGSDWPQYELSEGMIPVFAGRDECRYFVVTDHWLCGPFKDYWETYGGLAIFGYPITAEAPGGEGATRQFFERSRFEWHPGVWPEKYDVLLGHLGKEMVRDRRGEGSFQSVPSTPSPGEECIYFSATGQHLCDEFLEYWNAFGGLPIFGYPISQTLLENGMLVQYFERARFEHQPGVWPERFDVLQGLLGVQAVGGTLVPPDEDGAEDDIVELPPPWDSDNHWPPR